MKKTDVLQALIEKEFKEKFPINGSYLDEVTGEAYYTCTFKPEDLETAISQIAQKYADLKRKEGFEEGSFVGYEDGFKAHKLISKLKSK